MLIYTNIFILQSRLSFVYGVKKIDMNITFLTLNVVILIFVWIHIFPPCLFESKILVVGFIILKKKNIQKKQLTFNVFRVHLQLFVCGWGRIHHSIPFHGEAAGSLLRLLCDNDSALKVTDDGEPDESWRWEIGDDQVLNLTDIEWKRASLIYFSKKDAQKTFFKKMLNFITIVEPQSLHRIQSIS